MENPARTYVIHVLEDCPYCTQAKALLEYYGAKYELKYEKSSEWDTYPAVYLRTADSVELIGGFNELAIYSYEHGL